MRVVLAGTVVLALAPLPSTASPQPAGERAALTATVTARAVQPGEVLRLAVSGHRPIAALEIRAFDRDIASARLGPAGWRALIGIDLDVAPGAHPVDIVATFDDGTAASRVETIEVLPKAFRTRQLRVAPRFVNPPARVQARIEAERARLATIFDTVAPEPRWQGPFRRPIETGVISNFGVRSVYNGEPRAPHGGADFASPAGRPVRAPGAGRVVLAESLYFTGLTVAIDHGVGLVSVLAHLSRMDVKAGTDVATGARVGLVGATGRVTGPHLHWSVRLQGARVDPMSLIAALEPD